MESFREKDPISRIDQTLIKKTQGFRLIQYIIGIGSTRLHLVYVDF